MHDGTDGHTDTCNQTLVRLFKACTIECGGCIVILANHALKSQSPGSGEFEWVAAIHITPEPQTTHGGPGEHNDTPTHRRTQQSQQSQQSQATIHTQVEAT